METPFAYGKIPRPLDFTNRVREIERLKNNFNSLVNTIIISPRRWGKTSLVKMAASQAAEENKKLRIVHLDIFNIRSEYDFYLLLANEVLKTTSSGCEEFVKNTRFFLKQLIPQISFSPDIQSKVSFSIGWEQLQQHPDDILNLAEQIAIKKGITLVICIDEFQNIGSFEQSKPSSESCDRIGKIIIKPLTVCTAVNTTCCWMSFPIIRCPSINLAISCFGKISIDDWISFIQKRSRTRIRNFTGRSGTNSPVGRQPLLLRATACSANLV